MSDPQPPVPSAIANLDAQPASFRAVTWVRRPVVAALLMTFLAAGMLMGEVVKHGSALAGRQEPLRVHLDARQVPGQRNISKALFASRIGPNPEEGLRGAIWYAVVLLMALPLVLYVSIFCHEAGHALLGRCAGFVVSSFGMGLGRPFLVCRCGSSRLYLGLLRPFQGISFSLAPAGPPGRGR